MADLVKITRNGSINSQLDHLQSRISFYDAQISRGLNIIKKEEIVGFTEFAELIKLSKINVSVRTSEGNPATDLIRFISNGTQAISREEVKGALVEAYAAGLVLSGVSALKNGLNSLQRSVFGTVGSIGLWGGRVTLMSDIQLRAIVKLNKVYANIFKIPEISIIKTLAFSEFPDFPSRELIWRDARWGNPEKFDTQVYKTNIASGSIPDFTSRELIWRDARQGNPEKSDTQVYKTNIASGSINKIYNKIDLNTDLQSSSLSRLQFDIDNNQLLSDETKQNLKDFRKTIVDNAKAVKNNFWLYRGENGELLNPIGLGTNADLSFFPFYFKDTRTNDYATFNATLSTFTENFSPEWGDFNSYGRSNSTKIYNKFSRGANLTFKIIADRYIDDLANNFKQLDMVYQKLEWLSHLVMPLYNDNNNPLFYKGQPIVRMRIGEIFYSESGDDYTIPVIINNLDFDYEWTTGIIETTKGQRRPRQASVNMSFSVLSDRVSHAKMKFYNYEGRTI